MKKIILWNKFHLNPNNFPHLTILSNIFLGYALGRIIILPGEEILGSALIKIFLIVGACFFANYLVCVRKAARGINRTVQGKLRPFLRELLLCAALNAFVLLLSMGLFFFKSLSL